MARTTGALRLSRQADDPWAQAPEISEKIQQRFTVGFSVGDKVVSRVMGMTLYDTVAALRVDRFGAVYLDLTRFWHTPAQDDDRAEERRMEAPNWFRSPDECQPYVPSGRVYRKPGRAPQPPEWWG